MAPTGNLYLALQLYCELLWAVQFEHFCVVVHSAARFAASSRNLFKDRKTFLKSRGW